jgi:glycosyltransferase involved in cell wall biosynthesis
MSAMDVFVFPSQYEGNPLALLEAQAAALPCIVSDSVPIEADVVKSLIHRASLHQPMSDWVDMVLGQRGRRRLSQKETLSIIKETDFNILKSVRRLENIYLGQRL